MGATQSQEAVPLVHGWTHPRFGIHRNGYDYEGEGIYLSRENDGENIGRTILYTVQMILLF